MTLAERIETFAELGDILRITAEGKKVRHGENLLSLIENQYIANPWFTPGNVRMAVSEIGKKLTPANLKSWTGRYPALQENNKPITAGVIMAGNIPLVGFHDFLSVLISGNRLRAKTSSKDSRLIAETGKILTSLNKGFSGSIDFTDDRLTGFDVIIATGSDNSSRYFEYYFGKYPNIIRKNRNSIAVIEGDESDEDLVKLGTDVFSYFGLGCRNVSKILVPEEYDFRSMFNSWNEWTPIINHSKYANNYDYNKAVCLVNRDKFLDTGYVLVKNDQGLSSPVGVIYFENYRSPENISAYISSNSDKIQCITGKKHLPFGSSQSPELWDYPDNADTLDFLLKKNRSGIL